MRRRDFLKNTALSAVAISATGFIRFNGKHYIGDCETTTDILGPFYRPGSPVRTNLRIPGETGTHIQLSGFVKHNDCSTPYKKAKVELWHCDSKGVYDNQSKDFRYRGTTYSDDKGFYSFNTILPVPYSAGNFTRPAHFHMMITAAGYQSLVTQLYFTGDENINKDPYAAAPKAKKRILDIQKLSDGTARVSYDVIMAETLAIEAAAIDRLTGTYTSTTDAKKTADLFKYENCLWLKNEAFGNKFEYVGNNTFEEANLPDNLYVKLQFEIMATGAIQLTVNYTDDDMSKKTMVYVKNK